MANNHKQTFDSEGRITPVQSRLNSSYAELYDNEMLDDTRIEPFDIPDELTGSQSVESKIVSRFEPTISLSKNKGYHYDTGAIIFLTYILQQNTRFADKKINSDTGFAYYMNILLPRQI